MTPRIARGFTLIEVAIATALLVVIALGTAQLFAIAVRQNQQAREQLAMGLLAAGKAEDLAIAALEPALRPPAGGALDRSVAGFSDLVTYAGARYVRRWTVSALPGHPDLLAVAVRVVPEARAGARAAGVEIATVAGAPP